MLRLRRADKAKDDKSPPPQMPLWFPVLFAIQFTVNIIFIVLALVAIAKIGEFWAVDSRNIRVEIRDLERRVNEVYPATAGADNDIGDDSPRTGKE